MAIDNYPDPREQEAFRPFPMDHPSDPSTLRARLMQHYSKLLGELPSSQDWADFRFRVGRMQGIDVAINFCNEIEKER
jgi:hypothetical protein